MSPNRPLRVLAALSGGVDSSVAAARAVDAGHDVTAVHLALAENPQSFRSGARGCCTLEDARDARRVADVLGVPFYVWDLAERFRQDVVDDFVAEYAAGRTPNPCVRCNERIKFAALLDRARALGFDAVCTGHYARLVDGVHGRELHRSVDPGKDQSYVLGVLDAGQLAGALFPLGGSVKTAVREEATRRGLAVAEKPDSHDICFISDGDTAGFLRDRIGDQPGEVIDVSGEPVGRHDGAFAFTVGQRKGLKLDRAPSDGLPRYVLALSPIDRTVTVGRREDLAVTDVRGEHVRWCGPEPAGPFRCAAQVRAHGEEIPAVAERTGEPAAAGSAEPGPSAALAIRFDRPVLGVAPGQAIVLYDGSRVIGSATIAWAGANRVPA